MMLPEHAYGLLGPMAPLEMCRVVTGMWQVSGAHGPIDPGRALDRMLAYQDAGFTTWDLADHYGPAEDFIGALRRRLVDERGAAALSGMRAFTKWVPQVGRVTRRQVEEAVNRSLRRMATETLDLLQFHWWDYGDPGYLDALGYLQELRDAGKIRAVGLTNFDSERLEGIIGQGIRVVSNQVQYSVLDRRPEARMVAVCERYGVTLLAYGALCGGLLSARWLGQPEPRWGALQTASLQKYKRMIDAWGDWALFQRLLEALAAVGARHGVSVATVALAALLARPAVAGVMVGARLGVAEHMTETSEAFGTRLDADDWARIEAVSGQARDLMQVIGDCGDEYRR